MANPDWDDLILFQRAADLLRQAGRIQQNFLQIAVGAQYRISHGPKQAWQPPINVVETETSFWVMSAIPGVAVERVEVHLINQELVISGERPLPDCCRDGDLKVWEIPLGRFERRVAFIERKKSLTLGKTSLQNGLLIIELRKDS
jgi:HSP20 family molecular chaperone IbpA